MARKMFLHKFVVQGQAFFPLDMLRYDTCYPSCSDAITKMAALKSEHPRKIQLTARAHKDWKPCTPRWATFGWKVIQHDIVAMPE